MGSCRKGYKIPGRILYSFLSDLIFEDAWKWVGSFSLQFTEVLNWKWEASSKNNANSYLVRRCSSASMGIIFYFLTADFLIAFVMAWCQKKCSVCSVQYSGIKLFVTVWHLASAGAITNYILGNEKWYLCWVFWCNGCFWESCREFQFIDEYQLKKSTHCTMSVGRAAFLHNVVIVSLLSLFRCKDVPYEL